jgi:hypothetical protein
VLRREDMPYGGHEEAGGDGDKAEEEDDDYGVFVIHEVVAQAGATVSDAPICELYIEGAEGRGKVENEEAVEKAYGCVSRRSLVGAMEPKAREST